ncbi:MAG: imidazoleglycerol-phosphate dehydratase HisB [Desulfobacterales bacterium]|nr:imidazoleglycerol-phosphate dehydratase HisB [Desulfobacterales bacterium]
MKRIAEISRKTGETDITLKLNLDGSGKNDIATGIPFFDHMLTLFSVHGFFDLDLKAKGDIEVDFHHTVEDVGLVLGDAFSRALGDRKGINRYGNAVTPMDETLSTVAVDLSNRPFLVCNMPDIQSKGSGFDVPISREFFRAFSTRAGMNLHINVHYGENEHHVLESVFKALSRALDQGVSFDERIKGVRSSKGSL